MNKEFRRDDDGCLNLQNSVTDTDESDDYMKDDLSNSNDENDLSSCRYGNYILEVPDDVVNDHDCNEQCISNGEYYDGDYKDETDNADAIQEISNIY